MEIDKYIEKNFFKENFVPGKTPLKLQEIPFGVEEIKEALDSLLSTLLVMGDKTKIFEKEWSKWLGSKYSIFVNSGTSAVLLIMMWLKFHKSRETGRDEILIPAVTWSTSLFPAMVVGLKPILIDIDLENLCVNSFAPYITEKTLAVMPVHLMGHACKMDIIMKEAKEYDLYVIEDCCEAHGTRYRNQKVGTFGNASIWSFMFAHHMVTIEGGMISLDNPILADLFKMFRAHGWIREISEEKKCQAIESYPEIHPSFLFPEIGLNVRPTELNASFGIHQLRRIDDFIDKRRNAFKKITNSLVRYSQFIQLFPELEDEYFSPFAYPVLVRDEAPFSKKNLQKFLEDQLIHSRPIEGSNLALQPFMKRYSDLVGIRGKLKNSNIVHKNGFFIGLNQDTNDERIEYITKTFEKFFKKI